MKKRLIIQAVLMSVVLACTLLLNALMLTYCVEHQCIEYVHAIFSCGLILVAAIATRALCDIGQDYQELKEEEDMVAF